MTNDMHLSDPSEIRAGMGIHRPPEACFNAFVDPDTTRRFWITDSTGTLAPDATVTGNMNDRGACATVIVGAFERGERLVFDWGDHEHTTTVAFRFTPWRADGCYVEVTDSPSSFG